MGKYFTKQGLEKLKKELEYLKKVKRKEIAKELHKAASFGDLSENAAYDQAKEKKAFTEGRILELEKLLVNAKVIEKKEKDIVETGAVVYLESENGKEKLFLVNPSEADFEKGMISYDSPIGKLLLNKKKGDVITSPNGLKYKIVKID